MRSDVSYRGDRSRTCTGSQDLGTPRSRGSLIVHCEYLAIGVRLQTTERYPTRRARMREFDDHYEEEYVYLADLTDTAALVSWGKFFFASTMELVPDRKIHLLDGQHGRHTSIGANCESYGPIDVEVRDASGTVVRTVRVVDDTFTWVMGLTPDTEYTYRVVADPDGSRRVWADGISLGLQARDQGARRDDTSVHLRVQNLPIAERVGAAHVCRDRRHGHWQRGSDGAGQGARGRDRGARRPARVDDRRYDLQEQRWHGRR